MGTWSFPGLKQRWCGDEYPLPSSTEVKERAGLHLYSPSGPSWPVLGRTLPLPVPVGRLFPAWPLGILNFSLDWFIRSSLSLSSITFQNVPSISDLLTEACHWQYHRQLWFKYRTLLVSFLNLSPIC